tara:strand:- start:1964 stop:2536 length:573 start_codon:yes stop_codon:yes gene_type:complete
LTPHEAKARLRSTVAGTVQQMTEAARQEASSSICQQLEEVTRDVSGTVLGFLPMAGEIDLEPFLEKRLGLGIAVPLVDWASRRMRPVTLEGLGQDDLVPDRHGLRRPAQSIPVALEDISVVVVPGLAFNRRGHRLGRGGGYYDRFLPELSPMTRTIGICFDEQVVDDIPLDDWDRPVDEVLTSTGHFRSR